MSKSKQSKQSDDSQLTESLDSAIEQSRENEGINEAIPTETIEGLHERIQELEAELEDTKKRSVAHLHNTQRRHEEELQSAHKFASTKFAQDMLPVRDYLEMALKDESGQIEALKMGVEMTLKELINAFDKVHISEVNPAIGDKFDPNKHQAIKTEESDQEPNTILQVMKKGYTLHDRVLRPAIVVVAKSE